MSGVLARKDIKKLIQQNPALVEGYIDLEQQLQPNGFDITLRMWQRCRIWDRSARITHSGSYRI